MIGIEVFAENYRKFAQFDQLLGMEFDVSDPENIIYSLKVEIHHLGAPDACHGGVISALVDSSLGITAMARALANGNFCSTVEFKVNFLEPARLGETLLATAEVDFAGSKLITVSGKVVEKESGRMIAKGLGTFSQYPMSKKIDQIRKSTAAE